MEEHGQPAFFALRLKAEDGKIAEAETVVRRKGGPPQFGDPAAFRPDPVFARAPAVDRASRDQLASLARGYLDTLQSGDGRVPHPLRAGLRAAGQWGPHHGRPDCGGRGAGLRSPVQGRGVQADQPGAGARPAGGGCVDRRRGRHGLPRSARPRRQVAAGQGLAWTANYPYSIGFIAAFKIEHGRIARIDSTSGALPYRMPSPWTADQAR